MKVESRVVDLLGKGRLRLRFSLPLFVGLSYIRAKVGAFFRSQCLQTSGMRIACRGGKYGSQRTLSKSVSATPPMTLTDFFRDSQTSTFNDDVSTVLSAMPDDSVDQEWL